MSFGFFVFRDDTQMAAILTARFCQLYQSLKIVFFFFFFFGVKPFASRGWQRAAIQVIQGSTLQWTPAL